MIKEKKNIYPEPSPVFTTASPINRVAINKTTTPSVPPPPIPEERLNIVYIVEVIKSGRPKIINDTVELSDGSCAPRLNLKDKYMMGINKIIEYIMQNICADVLGNLFFIYTPNDLSKGQPKTCGARLLVVPMSESE